MDTHIGRNNQEMRLYRNMDVEINFNIWFANERVHCWVWKESKE